MFLSRSGGLAAIFSLAIAPALTPSQSLGEDELIGALFGGLIGSAIGTSINQQQKKSTRSVAPNPARTANREMQTALNYFGFPAGVADGVVGPKTRAAVSTYQSFMEFPVTGRITQFEWDILVGAMVAGRSGMPETTRLVATDPLGARSLLLRQQEILTGGVGTARRSGYPGIPIEVSEAIDEIAESSDPSAEQLMARSGFIQPADLNSNGYNDYILDTSFAGSSFWCSASQCKALVFVSTPDGFARNDLLAFNPVPASFQCFGPTCQLVQAPPSQLAEVVQQTVPDPDQMPVLQPAKPIFAATGLADANPNLTSHCSKIELLASERGGFVGVGAGMPDLALSEQFCVARSSAINLGESRVVGLSGVTPEQVEVLCAAFEPLLAPMVTKLSSAGPKVVLADVAGFVTGWGMSPEQVRLIAEVCMGVGYRRETMDLAIGSALLLIAMGETPYSELIGHHLSEGFGFERNPALAGDWFGKAIGALGAGAEPVFHSPQFTDRVALLQWAVFDRQGAPASTGADAAIPTFGTTN